MNELHFHDFHEAMKWFHQERSGLVVIRGENHEILRRFAYHIASMLAQRGFHSQIFTQEHFLDLMFSRILERHRQCVG